MKKESRLQRGFTLIEMVIVISIIVILISIAVPIYNTHLRHAHEAALLQDLQAMRDSIGQYTQDKNKAPQSLQDLVDSGYMRALPKDPFTNASDTWQPVQEDVMTALDQTQPGITDVHSGSTQTGSDGRPYNVW